MTALVTGTDLATGLGLTYASDSATFDQVADAADELMVSLLTSTEDHSLHSTCLEAAFSVAAEIYQARIATGGQPVAVDFTPSSYRLSAWITKRVQALVGRCWDMTGWVG